MPKDGTKRKSPDRAREKSRDKDRSKVRPKKGGRAAEAAVAGSMGATSMGPISARPELPRSRDELTELWLEARRRRHSAPLDSEEYVQACQDVARIEVEIAAVERALTPPRV
jgi:hypothetical protein